MECARNKSPLMILRGWIFDAYPLADGIALWILDEDGRMHALRDMWHPRFFVSAGPSFPSSIRRYAIPARCTLVARKDFFSQQSVPVWEVRVGNPLKYAQLVNILMRRPELELFNCDIKVVQAYHYERGHFPLAYGSFEYDKDQTLLHWEMLDSSLNIDYTLPPLRYGYLSLEDNPTDPNHGSKSRLVLSLSDEREKGTSYAFDPDDPEFIESLNRHVNQWDPDVILSDWGDSYILPLLTLASRKSKIPLKLSRDPDRGIGGSASRSFYTYGRVVYQGGVQRLFGRWHFDAKNSFTVGETGLHGLFEVTRLSKQDAQSAARSTIGTKLSSMQLDMAERDGYLIPLHKQQTEDFRDGTELLIADKGGLVFEPEIGWHERLAEGDFSSMYPTVMDRYNVSPETVNCPCCPQNKVPEIGHHICTQRRGLVSRVVHNVLVKRAEYKRLAKTSPDIASRAVYASRSTALKWIMVTCFGYLGFKNARFGKIEAHECVSSYGREILLRAKEIAEREGFHLVHANVDSLWLKKEDADEEEFKTVIATVTQETQFPMAFDGFYKWIRFCPAKGRHTNSNCEFRNSKLENGVPNKYFGCFQDNELKLRGIELRRHDTPPLFKAFQKELLARLQMCDGAAACRAAWADLVAIYAAYQVRIRSCNISARELAFSSSLSKDPSKYVHDTYSSIAARQLAANGITLHPGETIQYIIANATDKVKDWRIIPLALAGNYFEYDVKKYLELLERAFRTITDGLVERKALLKPAKIRQMEFQIELA